MLFPLKEKEWTLDYIEKKEGIGEKLLSIV